MYSIGKKFTSAEIFSKASEALLSGNRVKISYQSSKRDKTKRTISPIHLIYYRENWYLDAWCHLRKGLRSFMLSRIQSVEKEKGPLKVIPQARLKEHYASSYGIYSGTPKCVAKLVFSKDVSHEVSSYQWHPEEKSSWVNDKYNLEFPYRLDDELVRDILKYGSRVEVLEPRELRNKVIREVNCIAKLYA